MSGRGQDNRKRGREALGQASLPRSQQLLGPGPPPTTGLQVRPKGKGTAGQFSGTAGLFSQQIEQQVCCSKYNRRTFAAD